MAVTKPNPLLLAYLIIAGACIASGAFYLTFIPLPHMAVPPCPSFWARLWADGLKWMIFIAPLAAGLCLWNLADRRFKRAFADGTWTDAELNPVRRMIDNSVWMWVTIGLVVSAFLAIIFDSKSHSGTFVYIITLPMNALSSLKRLLHPPARKQGVLADWRNFKPLRSEHWGEVCSEKQLSS